MATVFVAPAISFDHVDDTEAATLRPLFAAALQCALHAHCNATQLLQIHDEMLQFLDGWLKHCPLLWMSMAASSLQPICNCMHCNAITSTVQSSTGCKFKQHTMQDAMQAAMHLN